MTALRKISRGTPADARSLTAALGGRWCGSFGLAKCVAHQDRSPSLSIKDGEQGLLLFCFAGCSFSEIRAELERRGLFEPAGPASVTRLPKPPTQPDDTERIAAALRIWEIGEAIEEGHARLGIFHPSSRLGHRCA